MIVRWGLEELPGLLAELRVQRPFLLASPRWSRLSLAPAAIDTWEEVPSDRIAEIASRAAAPGADVLLAVGGGSAIDVAKAVSAETGLPVVSVPTTYSGAEWTSFYGVRDSGRRMRGGGSGARRGGIVYELTLTLDLPRAETVGTALNALAHCAEALYVAGRNPEADQEALEGASIISRFLPEVVESPRETVARRGLLEGAMHAGAALAGAGLGLGHAMAQALGGRYGLPHGALNALCLPPALRFAEPVAGEALARFSSAIGTDDAASGVEELARLGGFSRLRDLGVPGDELDAVAQATAARAGAKANPRLATPEEIAVLLRSIW